MRLPREPFFGPFNPNRSKNAAPAGAAFLVHLNLIKPKMQLPQEPSFWPIQGLIGPKTRGSRLFGPVKP